MSINIAKLKEILVEFDAKQKKSPPLMNTAPGFNCGTSLFIGDVASRIRIWLGEVDDKDSFAVLNGAIDSFFSKVQDNYFRFTVQIRRPSGNDVVEVEGNILSCELVNALSPIDKTKVEMTMYLKSFIAQPSIESEIKNNCYFYLSGEIEGKTYTDRIYNLTQDTFEEHRSNIITGAEFTSLSVWCGGRNFKQELLTTVPF